MGKHHGTKVETEIMVRKSEWNSLRQQSRHVLHTVEGEISTGLVKRLLKYAQDHTEYSGFTPFGTA